MRAGGLFALVLFAVGGAVRAAEAPRDARPAPRVDEAREGPSKRALLLGIAGTAGYGRRTAGVGAAASLGVRAGDDTWLLAECGLGVGQMLGEAGDRMFRFAGLGLRDGAVYLGFEHRAARGGPYAYWGWLLGARLTFEDMPLVALAVRAGVGVSVDARSIDWNLGAALEFDIPVL